MNEYELLKAALAERSALDPKLRYILRRIENGTADLSDTAEYSRICSDILGRVLSGEILELADREGVCTQLLRDSYEDINEVCGRVQHSLDDNKGLHIAPQKAAFPAERVRQIAHSLVDPTVPDETIRRRADKSVANVSMSFHDDYIEENAKFRNDSGLRCYISRELGGKGCPWCRDLAGRYVYGEEPEDVYRRHDNCACTVTYENGRQRQDVWSKKSWSVKSSEKDFKPTVLSHQQAVELQRQNLQYRGLTNGGNHDIIKTERMALYNKIKWQKKGAELTSEQRKELSEYAKQSNIVLTGLKGSDVDVELIKEVIDNASSMLQIYPQLNNNPQMPFTLKIVNGMDSNTFAQTNRYTTPNIIQLNANAFRNKEKLAEEYQKLVKENWFPKGTSYNSIVMHEIGHMYVRTSKLNVLEIVKNILGITGNSEEICDYIENYLKMNLSEYSVSGSELTSEIVPEVFNAFYSSSEKNEFAISFMEFIEKEKIL